MSQTSEQLPPGQYWGKKWVIYAALGIPEVKIEDWRLGVTGLVNNTLQYSYQEFLSLRMTKYNKSFACVTKWSIRNPEWEGVPIGLLAEKAGAKVGAKWVMFHCLDGYTARV